MSTSFDTGAALKLHADICAKLNFAAQQSTFPVLRSLQVENSHAEQRIDELVLVLQADPAFVKEKRWSVDRIDPGGLLAIPDRDVELDGGFLLDLAESVRGTVTFSLEKDGESHADLTKPVELLAYNEWGGAGFMPELLAAFATPNDPAIDRLLWSAGEVLRRAGKRDQIDGYQSQSRERVWEIASAIYSAVANLGLTYAVPPASFERDGQKIRLPSQILHGKIATCLDTALLFASAFEQAGLNPVIALPKGHALAGVWLQPEDFSSIVIDDAETLRKRVDLKELLLFETTLVTSRPSPPFSKTLAAATKSICAENDGTFVAAVDIRRARAHRITPLGLKSGVSPAGEVAGSAAAQLPLEEAPALPGFDDVDVQEETSDTAEGRLERWQHKLLDLTVRNPLLNHRAVKTSLRIVCPEPGRLEDKLAAGRRIRIVPVPVSSSERQDEEIHRQREGELIAEEYARDELERGRVVVDLPQDQLEKRVVEIYRKAQTALQEGGANTLFLAVGFLLWKRELKDVRSFRAPLLLVPVTLERKSVRSGIRMLSHDDEPRFNTTLLEMLRRDFSIEIGGLDGELPTDESGIDVLGIWNKIRHSVKDAPGFEVVDHVVLGHFSFAKYLMWKDLVDRTDALRKNPVVRHLIDTPHDPYGKNEGFVDPREIDRNYRPSDLLIPLPADSSQMAVIADAENGKDFVVVGPPGTGKSQTISNLIAHLLGKGKTVLFVSEKTAALSVVFNRLRNIGLGRFCLELHSNKARKADVLKQLDAAWQQASLESDASWHEQAEHLRGLRDHLNRFVDRLHQKRRNGLTPYSAIGVKVRDADLASRVTLSWPVADHHDESALRETREAVEHLAVHAKAVDNFSASPFRLIDKSEWTPDWESQVVERAGELSAAATDLERACDALCRSTGIDLCDESMTRLDALGELASALVDSYHQPTAFVLGPDGASKLEALESAVERLTAYSEIEASLSCPYEPFAWRVLDGEDLGRRWAEAEASWFIKRYLAKRRIVQEMRKRGAQGIPDPSSDAPRLERLRQEGQAIDRLDDRLADVKRWSGYDTEPAVADALLRLGKRVRAAIARLAGEQQSLMAMQEKIQTLLQDGRDLLASTGNVGRHANVFLAALERLRRATNEFERIAGASVREAFSGTDRALQDIRRTADRIQARQRELQDWCAWRRRRAEAVEADLLPLVEAVEKEQVSPPEIKEIFEAAYCTWWSRSVIGEDDVLRRFSVAEHEAVIEKFQRIDDIFRKVTAKYIAEKLSSRPPSQDGIKKSSQWGVLRRELQKKRRHKSVRTLLGQAPEVLTTLTPCFMMSPLSVAQYLPADHSLFDVVIFDEASQITVWDAVGAIARGRQTIVAGDPKQMPPTNFFSRSEDDLDGDIDTDGDLESVLDEMRGAGIPERYINLHYRSRNESLIAFSNDRYYSNELITFPAPRVKDRAVRLERPSGFYARGGARNNQGEAEAIVDEILRRLTHADPVIRGLSIGVVTFNSEQQTLIENLLDDARRKEPDIEGAFSPESTHEPVFVKNLETVQGDERDVVLFSVTYGPDRNGRITMNFGPLNREGGERRLNVAITRARSEMVVFSTLQPDQIDLSRSSARAVSDLKDFLVYAETGALGSADRGSAGDFESPFEMAVARELSSKGWQIRPQVGVSAYRIDLGVVHPDATGRYLAGIECDGAMYHSSATARERDKIRQSVLENLGWSILRVWSTEWWNNKEGALTKVDDALRRCLYEDRQKRTEPDSVNVFGQKVKKEPNDYDDDSPQSLQQTQREENIETPKLWPEEGEPVPYSEFEHSAGPDPRQATAERVAEGLCRIVRTEGPVIANRAYSVYLNGCGIKRMGGELKRLMNRSLQYAIRRGLLLKEDEWHKGGLVHSIIRSPGTPAVICRQRGPRAFDEIPPSEIQLVGRQLLTAHNEETSSGSEPHLKALLDAFDLKRLTVNVRRTLLEILERRYPYVDDILAQGRDDA